MSADFLTIRNKICAFLGCAIFLAAMMGMVFLDVVWLKDAVQENSLTEIAQEVILAITALLFFYRAYRYRAERAIMLLVAGFFSCMLIRELDFLFDRLSHGAWFWFALAVTVLCVAQVLRQPRQIAPCLAAFMQHRSWGMMSAGMLTVLLFSRLFGMNLLWQNLMLDGYLRTVKNMAEEGSELLGYTLCLFATCGYMRFSILPVAATNGKKERKTA